MKLRRDILTRKLTKAFAENGSKVEIPLDIQPSGSVSFNEGFGGLYSKPVKPQSEGEQAGLQIQRENINWLFNAITSDIIQNSDDLGALEDEVSVLITSLNTKTPKLLTENLTWTVGSGEESNTHFNTLEKAITEALKYSKQNNLIITIQLTEDLTLTQGLVFSYCDCRNIIIDGQNHTIQKEMTSIYDVMFYGVYSAFLPRFTNVVFKNTGSNNNGVCIRAYHNSNLNLEGLQCQIDNFYIGVEAASSSFININSNILKIKNCKIGLQCFALGNLDARLITLESNKTGIFLIEGGLVDAWNIAFTSNTSDCNIAFNTLTSNGICFR